MVTKMSSRAIPPAASPACARFRQQISFLVKHLLVGWQQGAAWFWETLVDADLANRRYEPAAVARGHPMYSGALIMLLGTPFALASWWGLRALHSHARRHRDPPSRDEEKLLLANLPGYAEYAARIKYRLIPRAW